MTSTIRSGRTTTSELVGRAVLVDSRSTGHHTEYMHAVAEAVSRLGIHVDKVMPSSRPDGLAFDPVEEGDFSGSWVAGSKRVSSPHSVLHHLYIDWNIHRAIALTKRHEIPWIGTLHVAHPLSPAPTPKAILRSHVEKHLLRRLLDSRGFSLIVHSKWAVRRLKEMRPWADCHYIPYPISSFPDSTKDDGILAALPERRHLALFFGGLRRDKGLPLLVSSLRHLPRDTHLVIAGPPVNVSEKSLKAVISRFHADKDVTLIARHLRNAELRSLVQAADVACFPYEPWFSGQSGPLLLAAGMETPCATSNAPTMAETVREYEVGAVSERHDARGFAATMASAQGQSRCAQWDSLREDHSSKNYAKQVLEQNLLESQESGDSVRRMGR